MPVPTIINLNDSTPPAPVGHINVHWQADNNDPRNTSAWAVALAGGVLQKTASYTAQNSDMGLLVSFNSATAVTYTLLNPPANANWAVFVENAGVGALTVDPNSLQLDYVAAPVILQRNQGFYLATDGSNYFTCRGISTKYQIAWMWPGKLPSTAAPIMVWTCPSDCANGVIFESTSFSNNCKGFLQSNPVSAQTINLYKVTSGSASGTQGGGIGTIQISTVGVYTFTLSANTTFLPGDSFTAWPPSPQDPTLSGPNWVLSGRIL